MVEKTQHNVADLMTMYTAAFFEFPLAGVKWGWGLGEEQEVAEAAWKGYDAWVRLTSASIDDLYRNPLFGDPLTRFLDRDLRWQRLSQALAGAFFAGLWPAVGLPTAAAVQGLYEEIQSLTARLKAQDAQIRALHAELRSQAADPPIQGKRRDPGTKLDAPLKPIPVKTNGHRAVTAPLTSA